MSIIFLRINYYLKEYFLSFCWLVDTGDIRVLFWLDFFIELRDGYLFYIDRFIEVKS